MHRSLLIDGLKALCSHLIVWHHMLIYAPMSAWIALEGPSVIEFIAEDGRLAVQPFLVMAGFLAARSLDLCPPLNVPALVLQRYLRLAPPLALALLLVVGATWLMDKDLAGQAWVSPLPSLSVWLAHLLMLQDVLGIDSLSAGAWYVAIDLQLYALFAVLARLCGRTDRGLAQGWAPAVVAAATAASALVFSRYQDLDIWAIYFLSAYGLGALAAWASHHRQARLWWWITLGVLLLDWVIDPRARPLWAMATAMALHASTRLGSLGAGLRFRRSLERLSDLSYSLFVSHFAAIVLASGLWLRLDLQGRTSASLALGLTWALAIALAVLVQGISHRLWRSWPARRGSNPRPTA